MDNLIAVYLEEIKTGGQTGFEWFEIEDEVEAEAHLAKVNKDIVKYGKESVFRAVKREVNYDRYNNRVSM